MRARSLRGVRNSESREGSGHGHGHPVNRMFIIRFCSRFWGVWQGERGARGPGRRGPEARGKRPNANGGSFDARITSGMVEPSRQATFTLACAFPFASAGCAPALRRRTKPGRDGLGHANPNAERSSEVSNELNRRVGERNRAHPSPQWPDPDGHARRGPGAIGCGLRDPIGAIFIWLQPVI